MPFPRRLLNDDEDVVLDLHPHLWFLVGPVTALVVVIAGVVAGALVIDNEPAAFGYAGAAAIVIIALWLVVRYLQWVTTNFVVTTDRLIHRVGVLSRQAREIPLERVNDLTCQQSLFERMIGAGDLLIESGGERGQQTISDLPRPFRVQNEIYKTIEAAAARDASRAAGQRELSIPEQIEKLDELRSRGVISQAEFDAKKAQLLDRM